MASDLQPGFNNNINIIAIRATGTVVHKVTDRAIDFDGDGAEEIVTVTTTERAGNKVKHSVTKPAGVARSIVGQSNETDGGVDITGDEFEEGVD